jgi:hypothetical protein
MKIQDITEAGIDRRGFLRGLGAAAATAAVPGLAKAAGQVDFKSIANQIKDVFVQNLKLSGNAQPTAPGKFKFTFDQQGKLVGKEQLESCGDQTLDAAVLQSATNIPPALVSKWQSESPRVSIAFGVGDGWWKAAVPAQGKVTTQQTQQQSSQGSGRVQRFDSYVIFSGYSLDEIKDQIIERAITKDKDTQIDDNGRVLTLKMHNPEGKSFGLAMYKALMGPRYSNMDVILKFMFSVKGDLVKVMPQAAINITNAFGRTETQPMNSSDVLDSLVKLF